MNTPRVSVGMPVFNGARYIEEAVRSVLAQTYEDWELIISDNGSTDETVAIAKRLAAEDPRIRVFLHDRNRGAAWNYNQVFRLGRGEYFRWAPADDRMAPSYIEQCVAVLDIEPKAVLCYPRTRLIGAAGETIGEYEDRMQLQAQQPWRRATQFILRIGLCNAVLGLHRRETLLGTRLIQPFVGSDAVLLLESVLAGTVLEVPAPLFDRRVHPAASHEANRSREDLERWFNPSGRIRTRVPMGLRLLGGYLDAVFRAELPRWERLLAAVAVSACFGYRRLRNAVGRWRRRLTGEPLEPRGRWSGLVPPGSIEPF